MLTDFEKELSIFSGKRILITGGTGFIGAALARRLAYVTDQLHILAQHTSNTYRVNDVLESIHLHRTVLDGDTPLAEQLPGLKPDFIFHCAEPGNHRLKSIQDFIQIQGTSARMITNILEYAHEMKVERLIHICSSMIYGGENRYAFTENSTCQPETMRGLIKLNERNLCLYYAKKFSLPVNLARVFRAYGEYESDHKLIAHTLKKYSQKQTVDLVEDSVVRDYTHVDDIILGIIRMCKTVLPPGEAFNLASGEAYSARDILTFLEQILDTTELVSENVYTTSDIDETFRKADITKAEKMLNWKPKIDIISGLKGVSAWYQLHLEQQQ